MGFPRSKSLVDAYPVRRYIYTKIGNVLAIEING